MCKTRELTNVLACVVMAWCLLVTASVLAQTGQWITLADVLSRTQVQAGPAPDKFTTPFLVVSVTPIAGNECGLGLATNGTFFGVGADRDSGWCNHLPSLHALVWGRVRHSGLATFLRQSNAMDVASDYVDLVYAGGGAHPKVAHYIISSAEAIDANWGRSPAPQAEANPDAGLVSQIKANSEAGKSSDAYAASGHDYTPEQMANLIKNGQASRCLVVTNPAGAEIDIDGRQAGKTPMAFVLYRHPDADRVITIKLAGYNTIEKKASPDGHDITMSLTLEPEQVR